MMRYSLGEIKDIVKAQLFGNPTIKIADVIIDSRRVFLDPNALFFAIEGKHHDGHSYIEELIEKGISSFVVSRLCTFPEEFPDANFLLVENTLDALQQFASNHRKQFDYRVIGITGSNGKTIVKEWLSQLLVDEFRVVRSPKSFNSQVGVPLSVLLMSDESNLSIFEAGISQPHEMDKLERIIAPSIGIFTNIGSSHQENFCDLVSKAREKMKLFANTKYLIYCKDHEIIDSLVDKLSPLNKPIPVTWGIHEGSTVRVNTISKERDKTIIGVTFNSHSFSFSIPYTDSASFENAMHCLTALLLLSVPVDRIINNMVNLQPVAMRLELKEGVNGCTIINDSYNSDLGSLSIALDFLAQQNQHPKKVLILSDILQSGLNAETLYREVSMLVRNKSVDMLFGVGDDICLYAKYFAPNSEFYPDTQALLNTLTNKSLANAAILIKGSRCFEFEKISELLEQKTHRTLLEINLNALSHNLNYFRGLLKPGVRTMVMVKAFSYGSGSHEIASILQFNRVDYLGVAFTDEGIALREAGITLPIIVLNPAYGSYERMLRYNLEPEIFSFSSLESFLSTLQIEGQTSYPIHLKIDTGMHRLGFMEPDIVELIKRLKLHKSIRVQSVFSHLVATDDSFYDDFTTEQINLFKRITSAIEEALGYPVIKHILNSAGIERFPQAQFDMVRLGIGLYGISPVHQHNLQNVSTLKTFVAQIRNIPADETVGYNRKGRLTRNSVIATLPIGYADGLNRRLSNGVGSVLIRGKLSPFVGMISMDICMVDVTDIEGVEEGDEVVVFGDNPTIVDLANALETIPYEILTSISRRVKRIYIQE